MVAQQSRRSRPHFDIPLVLLVFGLAAFGVLSVSVATFSIDSKPEDTIFNYIVSSYYGMRQAIFFLISPIVIGGAIAGGFVLVGGGVTAAMLLPKRGTKTISLSTRSRSRRRR